MHPELIKPQNQQCSVPKKPLSLEDENRSSCLRALAEKEAIWWSLLWDHMVRHCHCGPLGHHQETLCAAWETGGVQIWRTLFRRLKADRALGFLHQMVTNPTHLIFSYISPTLTVTSVRMTNKVLDLFTVAIGLCILRLIWIWLASWEILVTGQIIHWTASSHNTQSSKTLPFHILLKQVFFYKKENWVKEAQFGTHFLKQNLQVARSHNFFN